MPFFLISTVFKIVSLFVFKSVLLPCQYKNIRLNCYDRRTKNWNPTVELSHQILNVVFSTKMSAEKGCIFNSLYDLNSIFVVFQSPIYSRTFEKKNKSKLFRTTDWRVLWYQVWSGNKVNHSKTSANFLYGRNCSCMTCQPKIPIELQTCNYEIIWPNFHHSSFLKNV